jgi:hypothetical protein
MLSAVIRDEQSGQVIGLIVLKEKQFSSGKTGFFGVAKIEIGGRGICLARNRLDGGAGVW